MRKPSLKIDKKERLNQQLKEYRKFADFKNSPYKRFGNKPVMCVRVTQIVLMVSMFLLLLISLVINSGENVNPWVIIFFYYSLWGMMISLFSVIFTIWANYTDRVFIVAFYLVEASLAANLFIFIVYWAAIFWVLRATIFKELWEQDKKDAYYWLVTY